MMTGLMILARCRAGRHDIRMYDDMIKRREETLASFDAPLYDQYDVRQLLREKLDALRECRRIRYEELAAETVAACLLVDGLPPVMAEVMHSYYIRGENTEAIGRALGYDGGYIRHLKADAARKLEEIQGDALREALPAWYLDAKQPPKEDTPC